MLSISLDIFAYRTVLAHLFPLSNLVDHGGGVVMRSLDIFTIHRVRRDVKSTFALVDLQNLRITLTRFIHLYKLFYGFIYTTHIDLGLFVKLFNFWTLLNIGLLWV